MTVKLFWYPIFVLWNLKLLDFLSDFVLSITEYAESRLNTAEVALGSDLDKRH